MGNVFSDLSEVYKAVLEIAMARSPFPMDDEMMDELNMAILKELDRLAEEHNFPRDDEYESKVAAIFLAAQRENRSRKFAFHASSDKGRYSNFGFTFDSFDILNDEDRLKCQTRSILRSGVGKFGDENNKFCLSAYGYFQGAADAVDKVEHYLQPKELIKIGIFRDSKYLWPDDCTTKIPSGKEALHEHKLDIGSYLVIEYIKTTLYFHNPTSVVCVDDAWTLERFDFQFKLKDDPEVINLVPRVFRPSFLRALQGREEEGPWGRGRKVITGNFPYVASAKVKAVFKAEFDFEVRKSYKVDPWAKVLSLGLNCLLDETKTETHSGPQFSVEVIAKPQWFEVREKPNIKVSKEDAERFLQKAARREQILEALGCKSELLSLDGQSDNLGSDLTPQEGDVQCAIETRAMTNAVVENWKIPVKEFNRTVQQGEGAVSHFTETYGNVKATVNELEMSVAQTTEVVQNLERSVRHREASVQHFQTSNEEILRLVGKSRNKICRNAKDFSSMKVDARQKAQQGYASDLNNLGGPIFEGLTDAKVQNEFILQGEPAPKSIVGDGVGSFQYNGKTVQIPEHVDRVYITKDGQIHAHQYKYSTDEGGLEHLTKKHFEKWGQKSPDLPPQAPNELRFDNVELIGPDGVAHGQTVNARIRDAKTGTLSAKPFKVTSDINLGGKKLKSPSVTEVEYFVDKNFDKLKDVAVSSDNRNALLKNLNEVRTEVNRYEKKLEKMSKHAQSAKNPDVLQEKMNQVKKKLEIAKRELDTAGRDLQSVDQQVQSKSKGAVSKDLDKAVRQKQADQQLLQDANTRHTSGQRQLEESQRRLGLEKEQLDQANTNLRENKAQLEKARAKQIKREICLQVGVAAAIDGVTTMLISLGDEISKYRQGKIGLDELFVNVAVTTSKATARGALMGGSLSLTFLGLQRMAASQTTMIATTGSVLSKALGPGLLAAGISYQSINIMKGYAHGNITKGEMGRQMCRLAATTGLSIGGAYLAPLLVAGPWAIVLGAGICIAVAVGDHYLGNKFFGLFIKDDPKEVTSILEKELKQLDKEVEERAYNMFNLEKNCSNEELKDAYRAAILKYHPDKCPEKDAEVKFTAIFAAYAFLKDKRNMK
ncbi:uncharacterized protein [Montipora capricornis]|uniref:uncharacterized protein n=1 Tax=Montipora capricornis TaxID=246305 RepID=UPI0035F20008